MKVHPILIVLIAIWLYFASCGGRGSTPRQNNLTYKQTPSNAKANPTTNVAAGVQLTGEEHWLKGDSLRSNGHMEEAVEEYKLAIENGYDSIWARTELGMVLAYYLHRDQEAIEQFRIAIQRDDKDWRAHWSLANSLLATEQYDEALSELGIVKRLDAANTSRGFYTYYTAKALDGLGRYDEALKDYQAFLERAKKVEPNSPRVREVRARVEKIKGTKK